jgi:hypothetical protein
MSKTFKWTAPVALLAAVTIIATPVSAQDRERGRRNRSGQESGGQATERAQPREQAPARQAAPPRAPETQPAPAPERPAEVRRERGQAQPQREAPRAEPQRDRSAGSRADAGRDSGQRAVPRREPIAPRAEENRRGYENRGRYESRGGDRYSSRNYGSRYEPRYRYSTRYGSGVRNYYRPYVFRPRVSIGFGIFMGYPAPYAYSYPYPIQVYGYRAPRASVMIGPGSPYYGGVVLEMSPFDADVYVDGSYAGRVEDFDGSSQPLTLVAGTHRIEVQAQGYVPFVVDVAVQAGQIIPYRGDLEPY